MAKTTLPTNYKDDILNSSMEGKRRYKHTTNPDGTVSLEDASTYDQVGSNFGASQLNTISKAVNESADSSKIISDPDTAAATTEKGYIADVQLFNHLNESLETMQTNFQVGVDTLYDKCVELGSTPEDKTPSAIADAMDNLSKYITERVYPTKLSTWHRVELGFKPKILIVYFYWNDSGTIKLSFYNAYSEVLSNLDGRYVKINDTGFEYKIEEQVILNGKTVYVACG